ncbi:MAG: 2-C-methyl-D-erythritol 4-phosphate cytidylyltransferase [Eggerthellaceae bacterium]|jgi:hypothetical protein|nr:2-C-methyl-D-erythritol 4-phosphate cytidylyltransferase [Eggerthellaceae bacterium]
MKYIIMADGKSDRWDNYLSVPKHFIEIDGEPIIERTIRLLHAYDQKSEVIVTSHNKDYELAGSTRYEPLDNTLEVDRFTRELIVDDTCFLYGDTYYTEDAIRRIIQTEAEDILFFGNRDSIVAIKIKDGALFEEHVDRVRGLFLIGAIEHCIGWQVYQSFQGLPFNGKGIADKYILFNDKTMDFNDPEDYLRKIGNFPLTNPAFRSIYDQST